MRVRGMWGIENPLKVFRYVYERNPENLFSFMCLINETKWNNFENTQDLVSLVAIESHLEIKDVRIKDPDNPAKLTNAKLITYYR